MIKEHVAVGKRECENCESTFKKWKILRLHIYKSHENEKDDEGNKMEITDDNVVHKDEDEDDKAGLKPNNESMKEANKDISSTWISVRL